jgi:cell division protein FtsA
MAELNYGEDIHILGITTVDSQGLRKGNIIDIDTAAKVIDECLHKLERLAGKEIDSAILGYSGSSISTLNNRAVVAVGNPNYEIATEDKSRVLQSARNVALPMDRCVVQTIERQYVVDGYDGVKDPVGMVGSRLETEVTIVIAATAAIQNMYRCAEKIDLQIERLIYNPILAAQAVLLPAEKEMGVVLIDIGGGTTDIAYFEGGKLLHASVLPVGGDYITRDLAIVLKTSLEHAVKIKEEDGVAGPEQASDANIIKVQNLRGKEVRQVSQQVIADIINARVVELIEMIYAELKRFGCLEQMPGGIVLTGGAAQLKGIDEVMEKHLDITVRLGIPENLRGVQSDINRPEYATVIGGLIYTGRIMYTPICRRIKSSSAGILSAVITQMTACSVI